MNIYSGGTKIAGIVLIFTSCGFLGILKGNHYESHMENVRTLELIFQELLADIRYGKITLIESFSRIASIVPMPYSRMLKNICGEMKWKRGRTFAHIFSMEIDHCLKDTDLSKSELDKLKEMGNIIDGEERDSKIHRIETYLRDLERIRNEMEKKAPEQKRICQTLGFSAGAFLSILLL